VPNFIFIFSHRKLVIVIFLGGLITRCLLTKRN